MNAKTINYISVDDLLLDSENPRLPEDLKPRTQAQMVEYIASKGAIEDLMSSIGKNGVFMGEALVAYHHFEDASKQLRVIEGNRRLTAVKLLLNPELFPNRTSIKDLSDQAKNKADLSWLPVVIFNTRTEVLPYLGSRHIVGVRQWEPLAKARYMLQLYRAEPVTRRTPKETYRSIAALIGSYKRTDYIKSNLDGLAIYEVIESNNFYDIRHLTEESINFGTLYTAISYPAIAAYVGAAKYDQKTKEYEVLDPIANPSIIKKNKVEFLAKWLFEKNEDGETVLGESRRIKDLATVLAIREAREQLESGATLDIAYGYTSGINEDLTKIFKRQKDIYAHQTASHQMLSLAQPTQKLPKKLQIL